MKRLTYFLGPQWREDKRHALGRSPFQSVVNTGNHVKKGLLWLSASAAMNGTTVAVKRSPKSIYAEIVLYVAAVVYVHPRLQYSLPDLAFIYRH